MELADKSNVVTKTTISEFREAVYQKVTYRPAAILDLVDALTIAGHISSPVALSEVADVPAKIQQRV